VLLAVTPIVILRRLDVHMLSQRFVSEGRVKSTYMNSMLLHALLVVHGTGIFVVHGVQKQTLLAHC
jgi:mannitol/fructose-specific phosphotransferase system IIA component